MSPDGDSAAEPDRTTAEVAEVPFTAFTSRRKDDHVTCRLIVRRVKRLQPLASDGTEQAEPFATYRPQLCLGQLPSRRLNGLGGVETLDVLAAPPVDQNLEGGRISICIEHLWVRSEDTAGGDILKCLGRRARLELAHPSV